MQLNGLVNSSPYRFGRL